MFPIFSPRVGNMNITSQVKGVFYQAREKLEIRGKRGGDR